MFHHSAAASHSIYRATHLNTTTQHHNTASPFRSFDNDVAVGDLIFGGVIIAIVIVLVVVIFRDNRNR